MKRIPRLRREGQGPLGAPYMIVAAGIVLIFGVINFGSYLTHTHVAGQSAAATSIATIVHLPETLLGGHHHHATTATTSQEEAGSWVSPEHRNFFRKWGRMRAAKRQHLQEELGPVPGLTLAEQGISVRKSEMPPEPLPAPDTAPVTAPVARPVAAAAPAAVPAAVGPGATAAAAEGSCPGKLHIIFSTMCSVYGDYQSEGVVYSHFVTNMGGTVHRITSCSKADYEYPQVWHPCYHLYVSTPKTNAVSTLNKAYAVNDWFNDVGSKLPAGSVVVLVDADMLIKMPLDNLPPPLGPLRVEDGRPVSAFYHMGDAFYRREAPIIKEHCGEPCEVTAQHIMDHFNIGPPHFMTVEDWGRVAPKWVEWCELMLTKYKAAGEDFPWDGDMFAFNIANLQLGIRHRQEKLFMLSTPDSGGSAEPWHLLGLTPNQFDAEVAAKAPRAPAGYVPDFPLRQEVVPIIHYCQFYGVQIKGDEHRPGYSFGKYDYGEGFAFASLGRGLLKCPPGGGTRIHDANQGLAQHVWQAWMRDGYTKRYPLSAMKQKPMGGGRNTQPGGLEDRKRVYLIRELTSTLNRAASNYRQKVCGTEEELVPASLDFYPKQRGAALGAGSGADAASTHAQLAAAYLPPAPSPPAMPPSPRAPAEPGVPWKTFYRPPQEPHEGEKIKVCVMVTVADDGPQGDGAAVMKHSILEAHRGLQFEFEFVAVVHVNAPLMQPVLRGLGFRVIVMDTPVAVEELRNPTYRQKAPTSGCCGLRELLKLWAFQLTEYTKVLSIDMDAVVTQPLTELWLSPKRAIYTTDGKGEEWLQGGFIMVQPDPAAYEELLELVREGDFRYNGRGWKGSGIGFNYGGETIQGLLPYYLHKHMGEAAIMKAEPCIYDNMGDSDKCRSMAPQDVKVFHFTVCQKPWYCIVENRREQVCRYAQRTWWAIRNEYEGTQGLAPAKMCMQQARYEFIKHQHQDPELFVRVGPNCEKHPRKCAWSHG